MTTATWCLGLGLSGGGAALWAYLHAQEWRRRYDARTAERRSWSELLALYDEVRYTEVVRKRRRQEART